MANIGPLVLSEGEAPVSADLIFVHGLRGDRLRTWTKDDKVWPRDLLPRDLPNVRIISWGYDADVINFFDNASRSSIFNHAQNLLEDLQLRRRKPEERGRPIIFVAHSLGGLVVKDALSISYEHKSRGYHPRLAAIQSATIGIIFAGTPHRGSNKAAWTSIATNLAKFVLKDHNDRVINALSRGSETLERLQHSFSGIASNMKLFSFFEDEQTSGIGKIVDDDSASLGLPHERKGWLPANHSDMIKYHDCEDIGYVRVSGAIAEMVEDIPEPSTPSLNIPQALSLQTTSEPSSSLVRTSYNSAQSSHGLPPGSSPHYAITIREHRHLNPKVLSYGIGEIIEDVINLSGVYWQGRMGTKVGLFPHDTIQVIKTAEPSQHEDRSEAASSDNSSNKQLPPNTNKRSSVSDILATAWLTEEAKRRNVFDKDPQHLLILAAQQGDEVLARISLSLKRVNPDGKDASGTPILLLSVHAGHEAVTGLLLENGATINQTNEMGWTALYIAAKYGHEKVARVLVDKGAIIDKQDHNGDTALHIAAREGHVAVTQLLIGKGAIINKSGEGDLTALHFAAQGGSEAVVRKLIENGAAVEMPDFWGETALHFAAREGHETVARVLVENGAKIDEQSKKGQTALHCAAWTGSEAVVRVLVENGANIDKQSKKGLTALHYAALRGHEAVARVLVENHADIKLENRFGEKAKQVALSHGREAIAEFLKSKGG